MIRLPLLAALLVVGCVAGPVVCPAANTTRCDGARAQVCTPARDAWYTALDCAQLQPVAGVQPVCCLSPSTGNHTCLPPAYCMRGEP